MSQRPCIIAAVDLDSLASEVIEHGAKLAAVSGADLIVAHAVEYEGGYESDHIPSHTPAQVRNHMRRYARASLVGLVHHLGLPVSRIEVRVESGSVADALLALATELHPSHLLVGRSRWSLLSPISGLASTLKAQTGCDLLVVPKGTKFRKRTVSRRGHHWLSAVPGLVPKTAK